MTLPLLGEALSAERERCRFPYDEGTALPRLIGWSEDKG